MSLARCSSSVSLPLSGSTRMINQIVAAFMLVEGSVFGVLAYVMIRKKSAKLALCQRTRGEVIEVKEHGGGEGGPTRHPVIRYTAINGETVTFESKYGDRLEILVSHSNPVEAEVVGFMPQWGLPLVFGIISAASIIGAPIIYLVLKP
jgi:hypothetical protein